MPANKKTNETPFKKQESPFHESPVITPQKEPDLVDTKCSNCLHWDGQQDSVFAECNSKNIMDLIRADFQEIIEFNKDFSCTLFEIKEK